MSKRCECEETFNQRYSQPVPDAMLIIEREVIGANVGANGYTTLSQASMLSQRLGLGEGLHVLDIGSGRGWPALYLADSTACDVSLVDLPEPALKVALRRSDKERLSRVSVFRGAGESLPFTADSFDAITHTDTLCCIGPKIAVLKACRRVLRSGGKMGFFTILVADGLSPAAYRKALRCGPSYVSTRQRSQREMLEAAGFTVIEELDLTTEFLATQHGWHDGRERYRDELIASEGEALFADRQLNAKMTIEGIREGLLRRAFFLSN